MLLTSEFWKSVSFTEFEEELIQINKEYMRDFQVK